MEDMYVRTALKPKPEHSTAVVGEGKDEQQRDHGGRLSVLVPMYGETHGSTRSSADWGTNRALGLFRRACHVRLQELAHFQP